MATEWTVIKDWWVYETATGGTTDTLEEFSTAERLATVADNLNALQLSQVACPVCNGACGMMDDVEYLIDTLITEGVIVKADLPQSTQDNYDAKKALRS